MKSLRFLSRRYTDLFGPSVSRSSMRRSSILPTVCLIALLLGETGCLFRTRIVEIRTSTAKLQTATRQELLDRINQEASNIKTLNATVDIGTSVGGEKK